ncbi:MAG: DUF4097 family beta strand repeat-containing protein [Steroidobacteraceae bacterium]
MNVKTISAAAVVLATLCTPAIAADNNARRQVEKRVDADAGGTVIVSNVAGEVKVNAGSDDEVRVKARLGANVRDLEVERDGNRVYVRVDVPNNEHRYTDAWLEVAIPPGSRLEVNAVSADIRSQGIRGEQQLKSVSGDIVAELASAEAELKSVSGDIRAHGGGTVPKLSVSATSGDVQVDSGAGDLEIVSVSGDIQAKLASAVSVRARTTSGDVNVDATMRGKGEVEAASVSGDVELAIDGDGLDIDAKTFSGDIDNCFGLKATSRRSHGPGETLHETTGNGAVEVQAKTMSGDIELCHR